MFPIIIYIKSYENSHSISVSLSSDFENLPSPWPLTKKVSTIFWQYYAFGYKKNKNLPSGYLNVILTYSETESHHCYLDWESAILTYQDCLRGETLI